MKKALYGSLGAAAVAALVVGSLAGAGAGEKNVKADPLSGYLEGATPGPISTLGNGSFEATIDDAAGEIHYTLSYADLEGSVLQSHIHFGHRDVNGGISPFLCTNLGNGPVGTPLCPTSPATVSGTIDASDVTAGAAAQGIAAGQFDELVRAIRAGKTYVNVHSSIWPSGEIRGQINDENQRE
jgi:hypothetical protein